MTGAALDNQLTSTPTDGPFWLEGRIDSGGTAAASLSPRRSLSVKRDTRGRAPRIPGLYRGGVGGAAGTSSGPAALGVGSAGPVRKALLKALEEARAAGRMTTEHELRAVLAVRIAHAADRAARDGDEGRLLKASDKLLELLDTLPVRATDTPGGGGAGDSGPAGAALRLLDSPPTLGDTADA